jgi:hypothetical protein
VGCPYTRRFGIQVYQKASVSCFLPEPTSDKTSLPNKINHMFKAKKEIMLYSRGKPKNKLHNIKVSHEKSV